MPGCRSANRLEHPNRYRAGLSGDPTEQRPGHAAGPFSVRGRLAWGHRVCDSNVPESDSQEVTKPTTVANDEAKRWRGGRSTQVRMDERVNYAYSLLLEGNTRRANAELVASRFNISIRTAHDDISKAMQLLKQERLEDRTEMLNIITASRLAVLKKAIRKGNYQVACHLLDSLGRAAGELTQEVASQSAPVLRVEIDDKRQAD